jgi:nitrite reductase/ring-hydroxylating ferredoxin subunit
VLGAVEDFPQPSLRLIHAGGRRLVVVATSGGFAVTDNACPHEGYGLVQGEERDGVLTCAWHNWKYRMADGKCLVGEEDLRMYPVAVRAGQLVADLRGPDPKAQRDRLMASPRRGLDDGYVGQLSRDIVRLLRADADPEQLVWEAVAWGAPRADYGFGHALASLVDCLAVAESSAGDARALPIVAAFAGIAESSGAVPFAPVLTWTTTTSSRQRPRAPRGRWRLRPGSSPRPAGSVSSPSMCARPCSWPTVASRTDGAGLRFACCANRGGTAAANVAAR